MSTSTQIATRNPADSAEISFMGFSGIESSLSGLRFHSQLTFADWQLLVAALASQQNFSRWAIGDALNMGETHFGEQFSQVLDDSDLEYSTVSNYIWVAKSIPFERRRDDLKFSHHKAIAALSPNRQDYWLTLASEKRWTVEELKTKASDELEQRKIETGRGSTKGKRLSGSKSVETPNETPQTETETIPSVLPDATPTEARSLFGDETPLPSTTAPTTAVETTPKTSPSTPNATSNATPNTTSNATPKVVPEQFSLDRLLFSMTLRTQYTWQSGAVDRFEANADPSGETLVYVNGNFLSTAHSIEEAKVKISQYLTRSAQDYNKQ